MRVLVMLVFAFPVLVSSALACNPASQAEFLSNCEARKSGLRLSKGGIQLDEDELSSTCEVEYSDTVRRCENIRISKEAEAAQTSAPKVEAEPPKPASIAKAVNPANLTKSPVPKKSDFSAIKSEHEGGAKETNDDLAEVEKAKSEIKKMGIRSANDAKKVAVANQKRSSGASQLVKQQLQKDRDLADQAKKAVVNDVSFTRKQAEGANDKRVKALLLAVSGTTESQPKLSKEEDRLTNQLATFLNLAATALSRDAGMESSASGLAASSSVSAKVASQTNADDPEERSGGGLSAADATRSEEKAPALEKAGNAEKVATLTPEQIKENTRKANLRASLRAQLATMLGKGNPSLEDINATGHFGGELSAEAAGGITEVPPIPNDDQLKALLTSSSAAADKEFSMHGAQGEVDAFLQQSEPRESQSGILSIDTPSLFERISAVHRACLKRKCVALGA